MSNNLKILAGVIIGIALISFYQQSTPSTKFGGGEYVGPFTVAASSSSMTIGTSDTLIQATTSRAYFAIVNDSTSVIYLKLGGDVAATANNGIRLNASGGSYELSAADGIYNGAIRAIAVGSAGVVTFTQR